ncbi:MAG: acyltransferase [Verrucomicrobiae bacterium]|nr:acyltransferase [Verrucomicrobiae bacterium]
MATAEGHVRSLDALRGALALYVTLHHVGLLYSDWWRAAGNVPWLFTKLTAFGHTAVIAFFLLSGFAMMRSHGGDSFDRASLNRYAFRRVRRLYGVYLGALLITALLSLHRVPLGRALAEFPANVLMLQAGGGPWWRQPFLGNTPLWSLSYEAAYYAAFPVLLLLGQRFGVRTLVAGVLAFGILGWIGIALGGLRDAAVAALGPTWWAGAWLAAPSGPAARWRVPSWLAGFGVGIAPLLCRAVPDPIAADLLAAAAFLPLFTRLAQKDPAACRAFPSTVPFLGLAFLYATGAFLLLGGRHPSTRAAFEWAYLSAPWALAVAAPALERFARRPAGRRLLLGLCGISYGLYVAHFPVLAFGRDLAAAWRLPPFPALGLAGAMLAAAFGFAWMLEHPLHRRWAEWLGRRWPR